MKRKSRFLSVMFRENDPHFTVPSEKKFKKRFPPRNRSTVWGRLISFPAESRLEAQTGAEHSEYEAAAGSSLTSSRPDGVGGPEDLGRTAHGCAVYPKDTAAIPGPISGPGLWVSFLGA